jgi:lambda family phage portal protein
MSLFEKAIAGLSPRWAAERARHRAVKAHFDAATVGRRASTLRADRTDADAAARTRMRMAWYARDMVRNTPFATRAQSVIAGGVVGDGILPKVEVKHPNVRGEFLKKLRGRGLSLIEKHLDTTAIDRQGRMNLYGLQRLVMNTVVDAGECLVRIYRDHPDAGALQLQIDVLETDYLDESKFGWLADGSEIRDGIEYDPQGRRAAYWMYTEHPGGAWSPSTIRGLSQRIPASDVLHIYRQDRPGQQRGVTWFAPVMMRLQDLGDYDDAQLMRQKIAACFAAFVSASATEGGSTAEGTFNEMSPGMIYRLGEGEEVTFGAPPPVDGNDGFTRGVLRSTSMDLGITYESLSGDLSQVNFSSARMGRLEMDQNISSWQWLMLIPQMLAPLSAEVVEAWATLDGAEFIRRGLPGDLWQHVALSWVPPRKVIVDPTREISALADAVRAGFASRQQVVRQLGLDPERLREEISQDRADAALLGVKFDSDPGVAPATKPPSEAEEILQDQLQSAAGARIVKLREKT